MMTEFILSAVDGRKSSRILDFGCGIGIPAFFFAQRGHAVTACDFAGTGTFQFLQWRAKTYGVPITFQPTTGELPDLGDQQFDVIVAMDAIEHVSRWRELVPYLAAHLAPNGILFANNAILEDMVHPEHYPIVGLDFVQVCAQAGLLPINQITFEKRVSQSRPVDPQREFIGAT